METFEAGDTKLDIYEDDLIKSISKLYLVDEDNEETIKQKGILCTLINGKPEIISTVKTEWNRSIIYGEIDIVMKPQYLHSAVAIYILIKYPEVRERHPDNFYEMISKSNIEKECLKIAIDVLKSDNDGISFINNSDNLCSMKPIDVNK